MSVVSVDDVGVVLDVPEDRAVDALFDGRRIWSFWPLRDGDSYDDRAGRVRVTWPHRMVPYLAGSTLLTLKEHVSGEVLLEEERSFGQGVEGAGADLRIAFVTAEGVPISLDKSGRFFPEFSVRSEEQLIPLFDAMNTVIAVAAGSGIDAFPVYGTLLGAIRNGDFLGHDSDVDLGYVSRHTTPVDVILESYRLQRAMHAHGFETERYSGGAFRVDVIESDGSKRGLDMFGGFFDGDPVSPKLYLMGEVGHDFREEWIHPLGTCTLAGREFPAPAQPERLLEAMYGPTWRTPDTAYKFETPKATTDRLTQWFRGLSPYRPEWGLLRAGEAAAYKNPASPIVRRIAAEIPEGTHVLDVGAGRCSDALAFARLGFRVTGYDYLPRLARRAVEIAGNRRLPLESRLLSLTQLRSVLAEGARVARDPGHRVVLARHLVDATTPVGREGLLRFCSMTLRGGGTLYAEFSTGPGEAPQGLRSVDVDEFVSEISAAGGKVSTVEVAPGSDGRVGHGLVIADW